MRNLSVELINPALLFEIGELQQKLQNLLLSQTKFEMHALTLHLSAHRYPPLPQVIHAAHFED